MGFLLCLAFPPTQLSLESSLIFLMMPLRLYLFNISLHSKILKLLHWSFHIVHYVLILNGYSYTSQTHIHKYVSRTIYWFLMGTVDSNLCPASGSLRLLFLSKFHTVSLLTLTLLYKSAFLLSWKVITSQTIYHLLPSHFLLLSPHWILLKCKERDIL